MRYIDKWLSGLGLEYIIPKLEANGITTPKKLAQLTLRDMFEVVGVEDPEDRKKLYFLIQRLQSILNKSDNEEESLKESESGMAKISLDKNPPPLTKATSIDGSKPSSTDEDLRSLRRKHKDEVSNPPAASTRPTTSSSRDDDSARNRSSSNPSHATADSQSKSNDAVSLRATSSTTSAASKDENRRSTKIPQAPQSSSSRPPTAPISRDDPSSAVQGTSINNNRQSLQVKRSAPLTSAALQASSGSSKVESLSRSTANSSTNSNSVSGTQSEARASRSSPARAKIVSPTASTLQNASPSRRAAGGVNNSDISSDSRVPSSSSSVANSSGARSAAPMMNYQWHGHENVDDVDTFTESPRGSTSTSPQHHSNQDLAIRVVVRKRPLSRSELNRGERDVLEILSGGRVCVHEPKTKVDLTKVVETQAFMFDDAFDCDENNDVIYMRTVKPLVHNVFTGGKATCFAYGQTGSGKTFTMMGDASSNDPAKLGLYVHAARDIFSIMQRPEYLNSYQAFVSCFEIYGGKLFDLLHDRGLVKCLEDSKQQVQILGLTEHRVNTVESLIELMHVAHNVRSTGATGANSESSRSHLIMQIEIKKLPTTTAASTTNRRQTNSFQRQFKEQPLKLVVVGKLTFIDLAGSERGKDTTDNSKQTRMEGAEINTSLLALKEVIRSLNRQHGHTPFRGSKLTQVLKDSFVGENTRTCMVACVTPNHLNCEHSLNTLRYADRVKEHQVSSNGAAPSSDDMMNNDNMDMMDYPYSAPVQIASPPPAPPVIAPVAQPAATRPPSTRIAASTGSSKSSASSSAANQQTRLSPTPPNDDPEPSASRKPIIKKTPSNNNINSSLSNGANTPPLKSYTPPPPPDVDAGGDFNNTQNIQKTVSLLTTHKIAIADMVEVMKEEMQLVQDMEHADDRDSEGYVDKLEQILELKLEGIAALRMELHGFQEYRYHQRGINHDDSLDVSRDDMSVYSEENDLLSVPGSRSIQQTVIKQQLSKIPSDRKGAAFNPVGNNKRISTGTANRR